MPTVLRCSSLNDLFACPSSVLNHDLLRNGGGSAATVLGRAVHEAAAQHVMGNEYDLQHICAVNGLDEDQRVEAVMMLAYMERVWDALARYFPIPKVETNVKSAVLTTTGGDEYQLDGTCDVISPSGDRNGVILDWKTGRVDSTYINSMAGYARCAWDILGQPEHSVITTIVVHLRLRKYVTVKWQVEDIKNWTTDLTRNVLARPKQFNTGSQCVYCDAWNDCPARLQESAAVIDAMLGGTSDDSQYRVWLNDVTNLLTQLTSHTKEHPSVGQAVNDLASRVRMVERVCADVRAKIKESVQRVGPIPLPGGTQLELRQVNRTEIDAAKAMPVLKHLLTEKQVHRCMSISLPQLQAEYGKTMKRGQRAEAKQYLVSELNRVNALTTKPVMRLEEVDANNQPQEHDDGKVDGSDGGDGVRSDEG